MEHSSSKPPNFDAGPVGNSPRRVSPNGANGADDNDLNEQIIADRLLKALSGGNLVHLEEARKAFVRPEPTKTEQELADLAAQLERRSAPRDTGRSVVSDDQLRKEEEALNRAERELERRRAEVQAAKRKAEAETKRRAAEEARRQLEQETRRRAKEEEQRLAELEALRQRTRDAVHERARRAEELNAEISALSKYEEEHLVHIAEAEARIRVLEEARHRAENAAKERRDKEQWLSAELETLREAEAVELKRIEEIETRIFKQMEARHRAEVETKRQAAMESELSAAVEALQKKEAAQLQRLAEIQTAIQPLEATCASAAAAVEERSQKAQQLAVTNAELKHSEQSVLSEIEKLRTEEKEYLARIGETEARLREQEQASLKAKVEAEIRGKQAEQRLAELNVAIRQAETDAEQCAEREKERRAEIERLRAGEREQLKRLELAEAELSVQQEAHQQAEAKFAELVDQKQSLTAQLETLAKSNDELAKRIEEAEAAIGRTNETRQDLIEKDRSLAAGVESLRSSEEEQSRRLEEAEARFRAEQAAHELAKSEAEVRAQEQERKLVELRAVGKRLETESQARADEEASLNAQIETLRKVNAEQLKRVEKAQALVALAEESRADHEAVVAKLDAREQSLESEMESLRESEAENANRIEPAKARSQDQVAQKPALNAQAPGQAEQEEFKGIEAEEEPLKGIAEAEERLRAQEEAGQAARVTELAATEQRLNDEIEAVQQEEGALVKRVAAAESRHPEITEAQNHVEVEARRVEDEQGQSDELEAIRNEYLAAGEERAQRQRSLKAEIDELCKAEEEQLKAIEQSQAELQTRKALLAHPEATAESFSREPAHESELKALAPLNEEVSWKDLNLDQRRPRAVVPTQAEFVNAETTADLALYEAEEFHVLPISGAPGEAPEATNQIVRIDDETSAVPALANRLQSTNSSERAAALVDLAEEGGEEPYSLIAKSFDDPSAEVRNAAARALCSFHSDIAASFTRALREASPERRRRIGGAIAGSGLAANAINNLVGEGRDQTYDAFSILFLMAKAGEVQPLIQAIGRHSNVEVRLTACKLLALSNQPQVLPALRSLAAREPLPPDVHSAVMEAIYLLSTHVHDSTPSLA